MPQRGGLPKPSRMWLPLYVLSRVGPIHTKVKFRKLVFLVQYGARIDLYDFKKHHYGPYSHALNLETTYSPNFIGTHLNPSRISSSGSYYSFEITNAGTNLLNRTLESIDSRMLRRIDSALEKYAKLRPNTLLEEVYKEFAVREEDSLKMEERVTTDGKETFSLLRSLFERYHNRQSLFLAATLESINRILSSLKTADTVHRGVVFKLTEEILHKCQDTAGDLGERPDSELLRPSFIEIAELESYLVDYCMSKKLNSLPLRPSLEDLLSEGDANRLQKVLETLP